MHAAKLWCIFLKNALYRTFNFHLRKTIFPLFSSVLFSVLECSAGTFIHAWWTGFGISYECGYSFQPFHDFQRFSTHSAPSYSTLETKQQKNHSSLAPATLVCAVNIWNSLPASPHSHNSQAPVWHERPATMDVSWLIEWLENIKTWPINSQRSPTPNHPLNSRQLPQLIFHHIKFLWCEATTRWTMMMWRRSSEEEKNTPSR